VDGGTNFPKHGWNYVNSNNDPMDLDGHGTHVAGIIGAAGNSGKGTTGVCWTASIMAVRVLDATGSGSDATIIQGIDFAITNGARVISMSLGSDGPLDPAFRDAITAAQTNDIVVTVSAGNKAKDNDAAGGAAHYPATSPSRTWSVSPRSTRTTPSQALELGSGERRRRCAGTNILSSWAGTNASIPDPLTGWMFTTTTTGGWTSGSVPLSGGGSVPALLDPANFPGGLYNSNTDDRAHKVFNLPGANVAVCRPLR